MSKRIPYGDARDRYPGGITYSTLAEALAWRAKQRRRCAAEGVDASWYGTDDDSKFIAQFKHRTDRRCPDCDVEPGTLHLAGCDVEVCALCGAQRIGCDCDDGEGGKLT